jgi:hypothetical protein
VALGEQLQRCSSMCARLAPYTHQKEVAFIASLPMTATGRVQGQLRLQEEERMRAGMSSGDEGVLSPRRDQCA